MTGARDPAANGSAKVMRRHLLNCPGVSADSPALATALASLEPSRSTTTDAGSSSSADSPVPQAAEDVVLSKDEKRKKKRASRWVGVCARTVLLELPLLLLFAVYVSLTVLHRVDELYLKPQMDAMLRTEESQLTDATYYKRQCDENDMSTRERDDLIIQEHFTKEDSVKHNQKHGLSVFPEVLSEETMKNLREFILDRNANLGKDSIYVIENEHRWSFGFGANEHPAITQALKEIASHPKLRPAIEGIAGENPAIIEMTTITAEYGAKTQFWHSDLLMTGSTRTWGRTFVPSWGLFVPLQDTTAAMGATNICPGSHMCTNDDPTTFCQEFGFQVSGRDDKWKRGYGALYNQHIFHRGPAHEDPNSGARALFIVTFAPRPMDRAESRILSQGGSYSQRWDQWGHSLMDMEEPETKFAQPWAALRGLGIYKRNDTAWGWDFVTVASMRAKNFDTGFHDGSVGDFVDDGGLGLPSFLEAEWYEGMHWHEYLSGTLHKCEEFALRAIMVGFGTYLGILALLDLAVRKKRRSAVSVWAALRLLIVSGAIFGLGQWVLDRTSQGDWAKDIVSGRRYMSPFPKDVDSSLALPEGPTTWPYRWDVLIAHRMDSEYLASYSTIVDVHHGNALWKELVANAADAYTSFAYAGHPAFRDALVHSIIDGIAAKPGRFLLQNNNGGWVPMSEKDAVAVTKKELLKQAHGPLKRVVDKGIKFGLSECRYGPYRDTAMFKRHTARLLLDLERRLLAEADKNAFVASWMTAVPLIVSKPVEDDILTRKSTFSNITYVSQRGQEPYEGAWIQEGDLVDAHYFDQFSGELFPEWYLGTVTRIHSAGFFDVRFHDNNEVFQLPWYGVRAYRPLVVGESVAAQFVKDNGEYSNVVIVKDNKDKTYDVRLRDGTVKRVGAAAIRRSM